MKEHIIINKDRTVVVPDSVRKIGIQYDHKVNTLTFDCPRYADDNQSIDLSRMAIYVNFSRNDKTKGSIAATNVFVDPDDSEIMHFDFVITRSVTLVNGPIICLVCAKSTDAEGVEVNHWNSELFNKLSVGEGMEAEEELTEEEIDYITSLLQEINTTHAEVADIDTRVEDLEFNQEKQGAVSEVDLEAMTWTEGSYITGSGTIGSSSGYGISELVTLPKMSTLILDATGYQSDVAMIAKSDHTPLVTSVDGKTHYEYYTDEEIQVYISCKTTVAKSAKIVRNVAETLSDLERENSELKGDLANSKKAIAELNDKKITKFYASNLGETTLNDSDKGKIQDMMLYGKSLQDGTPTPDNPIEIQSVMNPKIEVCGKNLLNLQSSIYSNDVSCENNTIKNIVTDSKDNFNASFRLGQYDGVILNETVIKSNGKYIYNFTLKEKTSVYFKHNGSSLDVRILSILLEKGSYTFSFNVDGYNTSKAGGLIINDIQIELGSTATEYEPYKGQTATLSYTLNAIPVSSGGNITIDGQQYIADYVDIENKKLVRMVDTLVFDGSESWSLQSINNYNIANFMYTCSRRYKDRILVCDRFKNQTSLIANTVDEGVHVNAELYIRLKADRISTTDALKTWLSENNIVALTALYTPTTIDLTDEEFLAFKALTTHYPTTNVNVTSDQLDGYTTFNYPLNMKNGWDYIKEQLGDTREYIYDMELQSAEAYVNSEYAVTLTELEV